MIIAPAQLKLVIFSSIFEQLFGLLIFDAFLSFFLP
jgi:hypothetical protein